MDKDQLVLYVLGSINLSLVLEVVIYICGVADILRACVLVCVSILSMRARAYVCVCARVRDGMFYRKSIHAKR